MASGGRHDELIHRISDACAGALIRHRVLVLLASLAVTVWLGWHAAHQRLQAGFDKMLPLDHPYIQTYLEYRPLFGSSNNITILVEDRGGNMFNEHFFTVLDQVTREVLTMPGIDPRTVTSLFTPNVNFVAVTEEGFTGSRIVPADFAPSPESLRQVQENLYRSNEIGRTVASDLSGALVIAELVERDPATGERIDYAAFADRLEALRARFEDERIAIRIIGFAPFVGNIIHGLEGVVGFFGIALALTLVLLLLYAGSWKLASAVLVTALTAVVWQLGVVRLMGYGIDPLSILVPFLVLAIGVSHAVQMTNMWRVAMVDGADPVSAARDAFYKLFVPGATALLSDAVGFAVILLINIPIIHELGIAASIGIGVMLITNKLMLPVLLSYIRLGPRELESAARAVRGTRHPVWESLARATTRRTTAWAVLVVSALVAVWVWSEQDELVIGDTEAGVPELRADSRYNEDVRVITSKVKVGLDELVVLADTRAKASCTNFVKMRAVDDFVWRMENEPQVRSVKSLTQIIRERNIGNFEANPKFLGMPVNSEMISANIYRIEFSQRLFNNECSVLPVSIYLADHKADTIAHTVALAKSLDREIPQVDFRLAMGNAGIMAAVNEIVGIEHFRIAVILFAAVALFCWLTFFELRGVLCVVLPLALVAYAANAVMVHLDIGLKVATLPVLALGVGVGVDYGIYLFSRMQPHLKAGLGVAQSYYEALKEVGIAMIFTSLTLSAGVATWYWSALKFQADMGVLLVYMFVVNMLGAVLLIPALVRVLYARHR